MSDPGPVLRRMRWWDVEPVHALEVQLFDPDTWSPETFWAELAAAGRYYVVAADDVVPDDVVPDDVVPDDVVPDDVVPDDAVPDDAVPDDAVAEDVGGAVLGYAGLAVSGPDADVQTVAVSPSAQGRGVGAALLGALVEEAARRGAAAVLLEVRADNAPAIALYTRFGFERIAVRRRYYQPGGTGGTDAHVMRLRPLPSHDLPRSHEVLPGHGPPPR